MKGDHESTEASGSAEKNELSDLVTSLIEGDQKDKNVIFNLISNGKGFKDKKSSNVFFDDFASGAFDVQDLQDLSSSENTNAIIAGVFAHTLTERSQPRDYKAIIDNYENDKDPVAYDNAHIAGNFFESDVVSTYFQSTSGKKIKLDLPYSKIVERKTDTTVTTDYGQVVLQFVFPNGNWNTKSSRVILKPGIISK